MGCPALLSWLQGLVDERGRMGDLILTGSAQFDLISGKTQSLAGRVVRIELLPLSLGELTVAEKLPQSLDEALYRGGFRPYFFLLLQRPYTNIAINFCLLFK